MNPLGKKIYLYNVTMGLYMLDWWERYLFRERLDFWDISFPIEVNHHSSKIIFLDSLKVVDVLILVLLWFICYNGSRFVTQIYNSNFSADFMTSKKFGIAGVVPT